MKKPIIIALFLLGGFAPVITAQEIGFGCLGFFGGYAGYTFQMQHPDGLNEYLESWNSEYQDSLQTPFGSFSDTRGFRFGLNFFRKRISGVEVSVKAFYEMRSGEKEARISGLYGVTTSSFELIQNLFGVGVDLGAPLTDYFTLKIVDASVHVQTVKGTLTENGPFGETIIKRIRNVKQQVSYTIGSGFILKIFSNYVSLEGTAGYTFMTISQMEYENGAFFPRRVDVDEPMKNFIASGGFTGTIQVNIGFPL